MANPTAAEIAVAVLGEITGRLAQQFQTEADARQNAIDAAVKKAVDEMSAKINVTHEGLKQTVELTNKRLIELQERESDGDRGEECCTRRAHCHTARSSLTCGWRPQDVAVGIEGTPVTHQVCR